MFRVTSILPPLSLSGSSTYSSLTLEDRRHRWVQSQLLFTEGKKKIKLNNQLCMEREKGHFEAQDLTA